MHEHLKHMFPFSMFAHLSLALSFTGIRRYDALAEEDKMRFETEMEVYMTQKAQREPANEQSN